MSDNGKEIEKTALEKQMDAKIEADKDKQEEKEKIAVNDEGKVTKIMVNGKEVKVVNTVTVMEIVVHKLESGQELQQVIAHEFMMTEHKPYMIRMLTEAINTVMKAKNRNGLIKPITEALFKKMMNQRPRIRDVFKRKKRK